MCEQLADVAAAILVWQVLTKEGGSLLGLGSMDRGLSVFVLEADDCPAWLLALNAQSKQGLFDKANMRRENFLPWCFVPWVLLKDNRPACKPWTVK